MSFQQGLSGLNASAKQLDVISNNVANSSTVGFKSAQTHFADVFAASLNGSGTAQSGVGVAVSSIQQQFTQGNITTTNNPLDIGINGTGFFKVSGVDANGTFEEQGPVAFTRAGQFHLDKNGFIVNDAHKSLTGYKIDPTTNKAIIDASKPIKIDATDIDPVATGESLGANKGVQAKMNLDSRKSAPTNPWADAAAGVGKWSPEPDTYTYSTALSVFDSLGNAHAMTMYFEKTANIGEWAVHANLDGAENANLTLDGAASAILKFDTSGKLDAPAGAGPGFNGTMAISIDLDAQQVALGKINNAKSPLAFELSFTGSTQFGNSSSANSLAQDGSASGRLTGMSIDADGTVKGNFSNGQAKPLAQVVLATFANPNGLQSLGNNLWQETAESGPVLEGLANSGKYGAIQSASVEESNVDLTSELVAMITAQRSYQANAQAIKTQDQILQTMVNLR